MSWGVTTPALGGRTEHQIDHESDVNSRLKGTNK